jgi:hypothetical protein
LPPLWYLQLAQARKASRDPLDLRVLQGPLDLRVLLPNQFQLQT